MSKSTPLIIALALLGVGSGAAALWWTQQPTTTPAPAAEVANADGSEDTGMTRFETEELMRTIGYTQ